MPETPDVLDALEVQTSMIKGLAAALDILNKAVGTLLHELQALDDRLKALEARCEKC